MFCSILLKICSRIPVQLGLPTEGAELLWQVLARAPGAVGGGCIWGAWQDRLLAPQGALPQ